MANDSIQKTLAVTIGLSLVCSVLVSAAAVFLKPTQVENQQLDLQKNILVISGWWTIRISCRTSRFRRPLKRLLRNWWISIPALCCRCERGRPEVYVQQNAAKDPAQSRALGVNDPAGIIRQAKVAKIYQVVESGRLKTLILPIHGRGLWSTLYGYIALEADLNTVSGFGFYSHAETPGLGGEVDNPKGRQAGLANRSLIRMVSWLCT